MLLPPNRQALSCGLLFQMINFVPPNTKFWLAASVTSHCPPPPSGPLLGRVHIWFPVWHLKGRWIHVASPLAGGLETSARSFCTSHESDSGVSGTQRTYTGFGLAVTGKCEHCHVGTFVQEECHGQGRRERHAFVR